MPTDPNAYCCLVCGQLMQKSSHWRNKAGDKITLLRCFNCFGDELRLTTGPKQQLPMGPPLTPKLKASPSTEQRLSQPYAIPANIVKQQRERRLLAATAKEAKASYKETKAMCSALRTGKEYKGLKDEQLKLEVMRAIRLEYKEYLRKDKP